MVYLNSSACYYFVGFCIEYSYVAQTRQTVEPRIILAQLNNYILELFCQLTYTDCSSLKVPQIDNDHLRLIVADIVKNSLVRIQPQRLAKRLYIVTRYYQYTLSL